MLSHNLVPSLFLALTQRTTNQVGVGSLVTFPVQSAGNRSLVVTDDVITPLQATSYSFAFWTAYDVLQVRPPIHRCGSLAFYSCARLGQARKTSAAAMKNVAGSVVSPNDASILSALNDFVASGRTTYDSLVLGTHVRHPVFF
jgi:hypothetical protein